MTQAIPMTTDPAFAYHVDPEEEARVEAEADRVFAPLRGEVPDHVMSLLRTAFVIVAGTHPNAVRARKRAREGGPVLRSGVEAKEAGGDAGAEAKGKAR